MKKPLTQTFKENNFIQKSLTISNIFFFFWSITIFFILFYFYTHGFIPHDEGWIINPAQRIVEGDIPYRDFHYIYTPGVAYLNALAFSIFGISIFTSRMLTLGIALLTVFLIYKISLFINEKRYYSLLPIGIYLSWGPMHINFAWPIIYTLFGGLLCCYLLLLARDKKFVYLFFLAGVSAGMTLLFKQNFGVALFCNSIVFFFFSNGVRKLRYILSFIGGVIMLPLLMCGYFLMSHAFIPFIHDMYFFMIEEMIIKGIQTTPFIYPDSWYMQILKTSFYMLPLFVSVFAIKIGIIKNKSNLFLSGLCFWYYILGIRPTTDYVHLTGLMALTGIPFLQLFVCATKYYQRIILITGAILLILLGSYLSLFRNYYRWDTPLVYQNNFVADSRVRISTDQIYMRVIPEVSEYIKTSTAHNEPIFIYSFSPSFYVIANRKNPTKFIFAPPQLLSLSDQKEIIEDLKRYNVRLILTDTNLREDSSVLSKFIQKTYNEAKHSNNYTIWKNK